ncbi:hypothetical protein GFK82_00129 [Candidatus Steffania adelgidicola]|nr:hypothetical protein GFK82_00129 [Candidatus Steffania adelgidicola]
MAVILYYDGEKNTIAYLNGNSALLEFYIHVLNMVNFMYARKSTWFFKIRSYFYFLWILMIFLLLHNGLIKGEHFLGLQDSL